MRTSLPKISIVTCTLNSSEHMFQEMLDSVARQSYPRDNIEHLVMDGGSANRIVQLAKKYHCHVTVRRDPEHKEQIRQAAGIQKATGDLVLILESDNILVGRDWLHQMVKPFIENNNVFCTYSMYNASDANMSVTTRYSALIGSPEPTLYYLKKTEKMRRDQTYYNKGTVLKESAGYFIVKFKPENLPTLGDNGHMFYKKAMMSVMDDLESYKHTDSFMKMLYAGYDTIGVVKNSIVHYANPSVSDLIKRRVQVKSRFYDAQRGSRSYLVYNPSFIADRINLAKYILYSITLVQPFMVSALGYLKIRDTAWFLHPLLCLLMVLSYGWSEIWFQVTNRLEKDQE